jgi:nitrogen fixation NifU-like protein
MSQQPQNSQSKDSMMELYQALILDHNKNPRNFGPMENFTIQKEGFNPVCGDHFFIQILMGDLEEKGKFIEEVHFFGEGCAISKASASMMTTFMKGKSKAEAQKLFHTFHELLTHQFSTDSEEGLEKLKELGKLKVFSNLWQYPARVKCAGLSWHTFSKAINDSENPEMSESDQKEIIKTE